jgi:NAD-dependent dihydropyrimidine dehydrogenase PreA subunit
MADGWYPIIDEGRCKDNCFLCMRFCPKGVYAEHGPKPIVKYPDRCLKGCTGCEPVCPHKAIQFLTTEFVLINGIQVGLNGLDLLRTEKDFESAWVKIQVLNYIPEAGREEYRRVLKGMFEGFRTSG